ncbi:MAG: glutamate synthase large subunit, partial [Candidatus Omnitrophica bacterium]|nr:glutamate synthase large subunit [Candidatus Omnitrophota bacterium]
MKNTHFPEKQGLYDPAFEKDSCGVAFVCNVGGEKTHDIILKGLEVLERMSHRGAVGADPKTGDGAGILLQLPHEFSKRVAGEAGIELPEPGEYGTGIVFLPTEHGDRAICEQVMKEIIDIEGQVLLGWRDVPVNDRIIGFTARETKPVIRQIFLGMGKDTPDTGAFERKLYVIRKRAEHAVRSSGIKQRKSFYITNISSRTLSYKGLLTPGQVREFYVDLGSPDMASSLALVHSRYSTNTFPTWDLAQPFRFLAHNGEINTLRGNINWFRARERMLSSSLFASDIEKIKPVIVEGGSDSAMLDNVFELLVLAGRPIEHAMMMLIPPAWRNDKMMDEKIKGFFKYHSCLTEPWDGPAAVAFTDGQKIGAALDRNGLRPARYIITKKGFVVMASEMGVLDIDPSEIRVSGRIEPGKMLFVDTSSGRVIGDDQIKSTIASGKPYSEWVDKNVVDLDRISSHGEPPRRTEDLLSSMKAFGYTREDLKMILTPMALTGQEPVGSMGNDTPHAFLSARPQLLYNYFKQHFAQVTNPPIDSIREELVMSLESFIGAERNILEETPEHCHRLLVKRPVLTDQETSKIRNININGFRTRTIYTYFDASGGIDAFGQALERICFEAEYAIEKGYSFIILSDRGSGKERVALPALLATGAVHHHLVRKGSRCRVGLIVESAEPREVHHFALLFGYGADCVDPYLAYEAVKYAVKENGSGIDGPSAEKNFIKAVNKGILKILSKMGISLLRSYRGAQIFEALGLDDEIIERCFAGTVSRIGGSGIKGIAEETLKRHTEAYSGEEEGAPYLGTGGVYQWKKDGEFHLWRPESIAALQDSVRKDDISIYKEFAGLINDQSANPTTVRSVLKFSKTSPIPLGEVEPLEKIVRRFATGAMSFGSISRSTHESIAIAMNRLGGRSNTGEGGEDPARFHSLPNGDSARSAIKQVASGRFGVTTNYLVNADEIQIKISQGAKPGEGGQLPGHKVSAIIARTRYTTPGVTLISPPPHHDIYSIEDLAELIFDLKNVNPRARISVKLVSEAGVGTVAAGVAKGHADMILISGGDGGTGASPKSSIRHAGLPWELGLSETHQTLVLNDLRTRVRLQTDGQIRTGRDVAIAALLGAEEFGFCTAVLITLGCVMLRHCHLNNCSLGVATQDELLEKRFRGKPEYVERYMRFVVAELREIMASLGMRTVDEMIGRTDLLEMDRSILPDKASGTDYSRILYKSETAEGTLVRCSCEQDHGISDVLDRELIKRSAPALDRGGSVEIESPIKNINRATGAMLSGQIAMRYGEEGLAADTVHVRFKGVAGQSFGAFLMKGVTFELEGMANDYVGKGISGGKIAIYPDRKAEYESSENVIIGNTAFYGAIEGEAYIRGLAGERFCVRNSGLYAVVEGVGNHGCEYMTGGRVVVLGRTGGNFAAGMSGGIAYVYDPEGDLAVRCNTDMVEIDTLSEDDRAAIHEMVRNHLKYTASPVA